ncbi:hypothetical protein AYI69_g4886 [Smittium culicis]|uniref:Uncharacterized protein n=1 Tax=Smittium culicis TaxID=133412 RepID=A0A1R1YA30_9FUNG|nr:hypothetical protein AYI69_g4886 [Smittium culicis]
MSLKLDYGNKQIYLYQTVKPEEDITVINVPNYRDVGILSMIKIIKDQIEPLATIFDICAWCKKKGKTIHSYGMKILVKKITPDAELPLFLEHDKGLVNLFYTGCKEACSYCKGVGH